MMKQVGVGIVMCCGDKRGEEWTDSGAGEVVGPVELNE